MKVKSYYEDQINQMYDDADYYFWCEENAITAEDVDEMFKEMEEQAELERKTDKLLSKVFGV